MRDIEVIDPELRLLLAIRRMVREAEGPTPNTARIDVLLDERSAGSAAAQGTSRAKQVVHSAACQKQVTQYSCTHAVPACKIPTMQRPRRSQETPKRGCTNAHYPN